MEEYNGYEVKEPPIQIAGRFLGIVVFLVGIGMLGLTFLLAYKGFNNPDLLIPLRSLRGDAATEPTAVYLVIGLRLVLLFVMGYLGSLIAGRGAHLFFSAKREAQRVTPGD